MQKLMQGLKKFQSEVFPAKRDLFEKLAAGQQPSTLFVTCADSRVVPDLFTQADPGELFVIRNAGNIVPPYTQPSGGVTATIEFAVAALGVRHIVVCGHTDCGAMKGLAHPERVAGMPAVASWLKQAEAARRIVLDNYPPTDEPETINVLIRENVLSQLQNLQTHPSVAASLAAGSLSLYGWVYDIRTGQVEAYDSSFQSWVLLDGTAVPHATPPARLRRVGQLA
jgi:carbonic anhydrase